MLCFEGEISEICLFKDETKKGLEENKCWKETWKGVSICKNTSRSS